MERFELSKIAMYIVIFVFAITAVALLMSKLEQDGRCHHRAAPFLCFRLCRLQVSIALCRRCRVCYELRGLCRTFAISRSGKTEYAPLASNTQTQQEADKDNAAATQFRAICFGGFNVIMVGRTAKRETSLTHTCAAGLSCLPLSGHGLRDKGHRQQGALF
eukprot:763100-Hanusia_phi.AAC.2